MATRPYALTAGGSDLPDPVPDAPTPEEHVRRAALAAFGRWPDVLRVVVRPLWQNCFRVNVFVGLNAASAVIAHSHFVEVGAGGVILSSNPRLPAHTPLSGRPIVGERHATSPERGGEGSNTDLLPRD